MTIFSTFSLQESDTILSWTPTKEPAPTGSSWEAWASAASEELNSWRFWGTRVAATSPTRRPRRTTLVCRREWWVAIFLVHRLGLHIEICIYSRSYVTTMYIRHLNTVHIKVKLERFILCIYEVTVSLKSGLPGS